MAARDRRDQLLEWGSRLLAERGWTAVTMQGLAEAASVSRQLVYAHFASLDELRHALLVRLFEANYGATEAIARSGRSLQETIRLAYELLLDMPEEQRLLLRMLVSGGGEPGSDLSHLRLTLRRKVTRLWEPVVTRETGLTGSEARSVAWAFVVAGFALTDLVQSREIGRKAASDLFVRIAEGALAGDAGPRPKHAAARSARSNAAPRRNRHGS